MRIELNLEDVDPKQLRDSVFKLVDLYPLELAEIIAEWGDYIISVGESYIDFEYYPEDEFEDIRDVAIEKFKQAGFRPLTPLFPNDEDALFFEINDHMFIYFCLIDPLQITAQVGDVIQKVGLEKVFKR